MNFCDSKIAWLTPVFGMQGSLLYWRSLLNGVAERCGQLRVFTSELNATLDGVGFDVEVVGSSKRLYKGKLGDAARTGYIRGFMLVTPNVYFKLKLWDPDLIVMNECGLFSLFGLLFAKFYRKKLLLVIEARPRFKKTLILDFIRIVFRRFLVLSADMVLTNNNDAMDYIVMVLRAPKNKVLVRPYLVSDFSKEARFASTCLSSNSLISESPVTFLYVGRLLELKGLQWAFESMSLVAREIPDSFRFDIVGDGLFRDTLIQKVEALGLERYVRFHGRQPYDALSEFYRGADVFVFPTLGDYRALVPFEALSMGLPILASIHDGGVSETVHEGENGFSFDPLEPEQLATHMIRIIRHPEMLTGFSEKSRQLSRSFTLKAAIVNLVSSMQEALDA